MGKYEEGLKIIEEKCGNGKDNGISLATIAIEPGANGNPRPVTRDVSAFYEDGTFYITTWGESNKIKQAENNPEVAFSLNFGWFSGNGIAENLGWVLNPKNAALREKLRKVFAEWYDDANDESNENCVILAVHITRATINHNHGAEFFHMDFVNKTETAEGRVR
jgi:general stress protein 26